MSEATDPKAKQEFMTMIGHSLEILEVDDGMLSKTNRQSIRNGILETISELMYQRDAANARAEKAEATLNAPALASVLEERIRQDGKWGEQNHNPYIYLAILVEEVGEMAQAALQTQYGGENGGLDHLREEAVQTAAVALAIVECLDRGLWCW